MVLNLGRAFGGDWSYVKEDILGVTREAHGRGALVKVILETDFLSNDDLKKKLCEVCESAAADFVKTSTGFGFVKLADGNYNYQGATEHDIKLMRATCSLSVQVKASGGVRDLQSLIRVRELGATRCGTSATKSILDEWHRIHGSRGLNTTSGQVESGTGY
jgi:deoxyribose-phosphate aldolase